MLAEKYNTSRNTIFRDLTEDLDKRTVCARFDIHE